MHIEKILKYSLILLVSVVVLIQALYQMELFDILYKFIAEKLLYILGYINSMI